LAAEYGCFAAENDRNGDLHSTSVLLYRFASPRACSACVPQQRSLKAVEY
jgi:hypothetical protein